MAGDGDSCDAGTAQQQHAATTRGVDAPQPSIRQYLRVVPAWQREACAPQLALRATNVVQQQLAAELGWPAPASLRAWRAAQAASCVLAHVQLPWRLHEHAALLQQQALPEVAVLQLQQAPSCSALAAIGCSAGTLHVCRLADLQAAAEGAALAAEPPPQPAAAAAAGAGGGVAPAELPAAALPAGCVVRLAFNERLHSCCWLAQQAGSGGVLATASASGVALRRVAEGRVSSSSLRAKAGAKVQPGQVKALDWRAAYQLAAATPRGLLLWDVRAGAAAAAELPTATPPALLAPMPGGELLVAAAADGQVALYDVRRLSSALSSVINFGGARAPQQLVASINLPARADEAAAAAAGPAGGAASSACAAAGPGRGSSAGRLYPYLHDVALNPADCNLLAYVRPDLQVGVLDLHANRVLHTAPVFEALSSGGIADASASTLLGASRRQAAARAAWDGSGRVLHTHGLLQHGGSGASGSGASGSGGACGVRLTPTLAAVDFGSWLRRRERAACRAAASVAEPEGGACGGNTALPPGTSRCWGASSRGLLGRGGQVAHTPLPHALAPTELALAPGGQLLAGTMRGSVVLLG